ncbi:SIMPL domain-containing protein [Sphingomonas sp. HDW15A]|uniref:SIMPL domain-containing protein n=1 Tax=Sphingomonas sp. HDW15A TaxID=2714942 RepID=UPI00140D6704|nr:SIMPL domain-containing protein [Sphingomonas sp. HDW15A]QIK95960.1 SIMPL domain-containing protein [Sphingomonas sp. HDW15A]
MRNLMWAIVGLCAVAASPLRAQSTDTPQLLPGESVIRVTGEGEVERVPDILTLTVAIQSDGATPKEAADANLAKMTALIHELQGVGVPEALISARQLSAAPVYAERDGPGQRVVRHYSASQRVEIRLRDLTRLQPVVDRLVDSGFGQLDANFDLSDRTAARFEAQRKAIANTRAEAENIAAALGKRVGRLLLVANTREGYGGWRNFDDNVVVSGSRIKPLALRPAPVTVTSRVFVDWSLVDQ